jgi:hypothetical protein
METGDCDAVFINQRDRCGKQEESKPKTSGTQPVAVQKPTERISYPPGDVRWHFVAKAQPLLDENARVRLWAGRRKKDKPELLISELDYPVLKYAPNGVLYFIGDKQDAIVAIKPDGTKEIIARSGEMDHIIDDDGKEVVTYNTFEGLELTDRDSILTLKNGGYPTEIDLVTREVRFLNMKLPTGEVIDSENQMSYPILKSYLKWQFQTILSEGQWILLYNQPDKTWYRYRKGEQLEKLDNPESIKKPDNYLRVTGQFGITGPDGYLYVIVAGRGAKEPDRVIRIGDPGLSSLRKEASRVTIAKFKHGELTDLAFSPKGELAVGAQNAIYLITPGPANKPQPEKAP